MARAALFGKLPSTLDYVRIHHDGPAAIAFDTWSQQAILELARANATWPAQLVRFLFAPGGPDCLVGVMVASRDRAGRKFPVAIFASLPVSAVASTFAALPLASEAFLQQAEALLSEAGTLTREELTARLDALEPPTASGLPAHMRTLDALIEERTVSSFANSAGTAEAPLDARASCDAFLATARAVSTGPGERPQVLDCPVGEQADVLTWLTLADDTLAWSGAVPSFFWSLSETSKRLLLSLGAPPALLPVWLGDAARRNARLTSVHTVGSHAAPDEGETAEPTLAQFFDSFLP